MRYELVKDVGDTATTRDTVGINIAYVAQVTQYGDESFDLKKTSQ